MWTTIATILVILGAVAFALNSHYSSIGDRVAAVRFLISGIALSTLGILILAIRFYRSWFERRYVRRSELPPTPPIKSDLKFRFGVYWDSELNPLCPADTTPLTLSTSKLLYVISDDVPPPKPVLHCLKCDKVIPLYDDFGKEITLSEAKRLLSLENPNNPNRLQAIERLQMIANHLPSGEVMEKYVDIYHQALSEIQPHTKDDLMKFCIPPEELKHHEIHYKATPNIGSRRGSPAHTIRSQDRYCDRAVFLMALYGAISSLRSPR